MRTPTAGLNFFIHEGNIVEVATEDGIGYYPRCWVGTEVDGINYLSPLYFLAEMQSTPDGEDYYLRTSEALCNEFIDRIKAFGSINLDKWEVHTPGEYDLESEWAADYEQEQRERLGV